MGSWHAHKRRGEDVRGMFGCASSVLPISEVGEGSDDRKGLSEEMPD